LRPRPDDAEMAFLNEFGRFGRRCWVGPAMGGDERRRGELGIALGIGDPLVVDALSARPTIDEVVRWHPIVTGESPGIRSVAVRIRRPDREPKEFTGDSVAERLREALEGAQRAGGDAVEQAARVHWSIVQVHPFLNGNGRVSRFFASIVLLGAGLPPLVVPRRERNAGYSAALDSEDFGAFHQFVRRRTVENAVWWVERERSAVASEPIVEEGLRVQAKRLLGGLGRELAQIIGEDPTELSSPTAAWLGRAAAAAMGSGQGLGLHRGVTGLTCGPVWLVFEPVLCRYDVAWLATLMGPGRAPAGASRWLWLPADAAAPSRGQRWVREQLSLWASTLARRQE
jgi:prophage maintenance system killer protein